MSDNQSPTCDCSILPYPGHLGFINTFNWASRDYVAEPEPAPLADYHLTDDELAEREAFIAGMVHVDDLLDFEDYSDPDASYISYVELRQLYEQDGLLS